VELFNYHNGYFGANNGNKRATPSAPRITADPRVVSFQELLLNYCSVTTLGVIINLMIRSFADTETEKVFNREFSRKLPPNIQSNARRKLELLSVAKVLNDM